MLILDSDLARQEMPPPDLFVQPLEPAPGCRDPLPTLRPSPDAVHDLITVTQEAWRHAVQ